MTRKLVQGLAVGILLCNILDWMADGKAVEPLTDTSSSPAPGENSILNSTSSPVKVQVENVTSNVISDAGVVEGVVKKGNFTSSNYIIEYKPQVFDSPEDIKTQQEWGGNCTLYHWDKCKALESWFGNYEDPKDGEIKNYMIDCKLEPVVCLKNSWTVTRCNLLCMSRCNREISFKYDKYVLHNGECKAHAHG